MTQEQITEILQQINTINKGTGVSDELSCALLQMAVDSITLSTLQSLIKPEQQNTAPTQRAAVRPRGGNSKTGFKFTKKELKEIPVMYKKIFVCNDKIVPYRFHKGVYEAHYRRNGVEVFAYAKEFDEMKRRFILKLNQLADANVQPITQRKPEIKPQEVKKEDTILFTDYVKQWLEIKRKTTKVSTFKEYERLCSYNLLTAFENKTIGNMTRAVIQDYLFKMVDEGKNRTAEKLTQIMGSIFDLACDDLNIPSLMNRIVLPYYETKKGKCLTFEEEAKLVKFCIENKDNAATSALLVLLYFGLRKSELCTIEVQDDKLTCISSKTRLGRGDVKRTIPFTPVFKRVLQYVDFDKAKNANVHTIETTFKRLFPKHHPHELRYTFITRCNVRVKKGK